MFRVGQKVIFVGGERHPMGWGGHHPPLGIGKIYTIREIDALYIDYYGSAGIRVFESISAKIAWAGGNTEPAVLAYKFRPIVERKTDISALQALLVPGAKIRESADA